MARHLSFSPGVLVVSDDPELGGLLALNLRLRGLTVEQTDLALALAPAWEPTLEHLGLLILDVEVEGRLSPRQLRSLAERPWAAGVPLLLAAQRPTSLTTSLVTPPAALIGRPDDVRSVVAAARSLLRATLAPI